jgi:hypothetical protein
MRKDRKTDKTASVSNIQGYHETTSYGDRESYAYQGFRSNKYFTSDRFMALDDNFRRPDGKPLKGYGLEIETECRGISNPTVLAECMDKIVFSHFPDDLFKMQRDGSLGGDSSVECITQVMTREFVRNNYANFKLMYNTYFPAFKVSAGGPSCGMHVNISTACFGSAEKTIADNIRKLYYIVNRHFDFCCELFRRNRHATHYCARMPYDRAKTLDLGSQACSHGVCFNLGHYNAGRIEIRLVGGQKDFASFRNTMECVFFLVDRVKTLKWADLDNLGVIFKGCNQYVFDRLKSYCYQNGTISATDIDAIRPTVVREELI